MAKKIVASKRQVAAARRECGCQKAEENFALVAATLVLLTTMMQPLIAAGLAVVLLVGFAIYKRMMANGSWPCKGCK